MKIKIAFLLLFAFLFIACPSAVVDPPDPPPIQEFVKVWICSDNPDFLSRWDCREGVLVKFKKGLEPTAICEIDHSPIKYIHVDVCRDSLLIPNQYCPKVGSKKYIKGKEPTAICKIHKKPLPPDIEINICLDNDSPKKARDDCPSTKVRTFPASTILEVCGLNHTVIPPPKKLSVSGNKFYYGDNEIRLAGCSRVEALWRALKIRGFDEGWGDNYSQEEYEQDLINSGMNFIRQLGVKDTQFLYDFCKRMKEAGIIVSIGVYRVDENEGILVNLEDMGDLAKLGNVFFDICNEFIGSDESEIQTVIDIANNLRSQGCLVSAGAWSGDNGKRLSRLFHQRYSEHDIESHHREWEIDSFRETLSYGKPVVFDEFFSQGNKTLQEIKDIFKMSVDLGIATNYYGYRIDIPHLKTRDPFPKDAIPKYAGQLAKRLNQ